MAYINYMKEALEIAKKSGAAGIEIPVGCVIVRDGKVIAAAHNQKETLRDPSAHAEILALREAAQQLDSWRLDGCKMYVTLEPCPMCMWAILNARIDELYFGAYDFNYGAAGSKLNLAPLLGSKGNSKIKIFGGVCEKECENLLKDYFAKMRASNPLCVESQDAR